MTIADPITIGSATGTSGSSRAMTTTANVPAGARILVIAGCDNTRTVSSVTDGTNTYTLLKGGTRYMGLAIYFSAVLAAQLNSGATITANYSGAAFAENFVAAAYVTGLDTSPSDSAAAVEVAGPGTTSPTVTSGTLATANEIVLGIVFGYNTSALGLVFTEPGGFAAISTTNNIGADKAAFNWAFKKVTATTAVTYNPTTNNSVSPNSCIMVAALKGATDIAAFLQRSEDLGRRRTAFTDAPALGITAPTAVVGPSGVAWSQRFEEFKGRPRFTDMPAYGIPPVPAVGVQGVAWSERLDYATPRKGRTDPQAIILRGVPAVGVSGIAWSQRIDYAWPRKGRTDPAALDPKVTPAVGVSGIPWSQRFEPFYGRPIMFTTPQGFAHRGVPAVGPSGIAWATRYEQVFYGPKAFTVPIGWAVSPDVIRLYPIDRPRGAVPKWRFLG